MVFAADINSYDQGFACYLRDLLVLCIIHVGTPLQFYVVRQLWPVSDLHFTVG